MTVTKRQLTKVLVILVVLLLVIAGCGGTEENQEQSGSVPIEQGINKNADTDLKETDQTNDAETNQPETAETQLSAIEEATITGQIAKAYVEMLENHPLHRHGVLSPDNRYYAYEERSSVILVRLPTPGAYLADNTIAPRVLFTDGGRKGSSFAEMELDYARRLEDPPLTDEELDVARNKLRSVYNWDFYFYLIYSEDGRYLAYLNESNFGDDRICTIKVVDLKDNCKLYTLPVEETSEYAEITWQADDQTLELYLPWAESVEGGALALRRQWHIPSGQSKTTYYRQDQTEYGEEISLAVAQKEIKEFAEVEKERNRAAEQLARLTVEERVAALTPEELAAEYAKYYRPLAAEEIKMLQEKGYSEETISKMDSLDFDELNRPLTETENAPPEEHQQEIFERGLPKDINWRVAKEFYGWENMLAYTNEAIMAMYEAVKETEALFEKEEAYRLAVRKAYLKREIS
ncbi:MAG: hypothetical protein CVU87_05175 [Firmicutes bacterium HGW-Firmicutes-12]|nr:MAG: hypothetical protein CVU87_05175 [Firmicutes bacterium HGW-Firmicutes-12]